MLPLNLSDTAATSQDGSSLEYIAAIAGRQCYIQDASGRERSPNISALKKTESQTWGGDVVKKTESPLFVDSVFFQSWKKTESTKS